MIELLLYLTLFVLLLLLYKFFYRSLNITSRVDDGYETDGIIARKRHKRILTPTRKSRKNIF